MLFEVNKTILDNQYQFHKSKRRGMREYYINFVSFTIKLKLTYVSLIYLFKKSNQNLSLNKTNLEDCQNSVYCYFPFSNVYW